MFVVSLVWLLSNAFCLIPLLDVSINERVFLPSFIGISFHNLGLFRRVYVAGASFGHQHLGPNMYGLDGLYFSCWLGCRVTTYDNGTLSSGEVLKRIIVGRLFVGGGPIRGNLRFVSLR